MAYSWSQVEPWKEKRRHFTDGRPRATRWLGWDTETCLGDIMLLCNSDGDALWEPDAHALFKALYRPDVRSVWYNIRFDIECVLKNLPEKVLQKLYIDGETEWEGYEVKWIPRKMLAIGRRDDQEKRSYHYDAAHFFESSLDRAAKLHLGEGKRGLTKEKVIKLGSSRGAWKKAHRPAVLAYCRRDARLTARLMEHFERQAVALGLPFDHPISPASVAGRYALEVKDLDARPRHGPLAQAGFEAFRGGWFETRVRGTLDTYEADINSAYPYGMSQLPDWRVPWRDVTREDDALLYDWGMVYADVRRVDPDLPWSPILVSNGDSLYAPRGVVGQVCMTLDEYRALKDSPGFDLRFTRGVLAEDDGTRPLSWVADLYAERKVLKRTCGACGSVRDQDVSAANPCNCGGKSPDPRQGVVKIMMNSLYGKMLQKMPVISTMEPRTDGKVSLSDIVTPDGVFTRKTMLRVGPMYNPVWAAHVTAWTRLKIWAAMQMHDVVAVATDGVLTRDPPTRLPRSDALGDWGVAPLAKTVIVGNGLYERLGEKTRMRGIQKPLEAAPVRRRLGFASVDWFTVLSKKPRATKIPFETTRPYHPPEVMKSLSLGLKDVGRFDTTIKNVDLNEAGKRRFPPLTAGRLLKGVYDGIPYTLGEVEA